jgi:hypothetical protein
VLGAPGGGIGVKSSKEANSFFRQCLTTTQEEELTSRINYLTDHGMPPTSSIVKNLAEEIREAVSERTTLANSSSVIG